MIWRKPVSWSKFKTGLDCPMKLGFELSKTPSSVSRPTFYADLGTIVQKVFEEYFNQGVNLKNGGDQVRVVEAVTNKVFNSVWYNQIKTSFPYGKSEDDLKSEVLRLVQNGFEQFKSLGLIKRVIRSEVKWSSVFRNMRMFGMIDFVIEDGNAVKIYDGKGHAQKNADPNQLLYYGLMVVASGRKLKHTGFFYWKHDFEEVDASPEALKVFVDGEFERGRELFYKLQQGTEDLPATPSEKVCNYCQWNRTCKYSAVKPKEVEIKDSTTVLFGEI